MPRLPSPGDFLPLHTLVALALIIAYVVTTVTGHDGTPVLGVLVGYLGGATLEYRRSDTGTTGK